MKITVNLKVVCFMGEGMGLWLLLWNRGKGRDRPKWPFGVRQPATAIRGRRETIFEEHIVYGRWRFARDHHLDICGKCACGRVDIIGNGSCFRDL